MLSVCRKEEEGSTSKSKRMTVRQNANLKCELKKIMGSKCLSCYREDGRHGRGRNRKKFLGLWSRNDHQRGKGGQSMRWVRGGVSIPSPQPWTVPRYRWTGCLAEGGSEIHDRRFPSPLEECHL